MTHHRTLAARRSAGTEPAIEAEARTARTDSSPLSGPLSQRWLALAAAGFLGFLALTLSVVISGGRDAFDSTVLHVVTSGRSTAVIRVAMLVTNLGAVPVVVAITVCVSGLLWWRTRSWVTPLVLLTSVGLTGAIVYLCKIAVARARPPVTSLVGSPSTDYAFPSGHTTDGSIMLLLAATLIGLTVTRRAVRLLLLVIAVVLAVAIGLTRVYLAYHWATDVLAGWMLAVAISCTAAYLAALLGAGRPRSVTS